MHRRHGSHACRRQRVLDLQSDLRQGNQRMGGSVPQPRRQPDRDDPPRLDHDSLYRMHHVITARSAEQRNRHLQRRRGRTGGPVLHLQRGRWQCSRLLRSGPNLQAGFLLRFGDRPRWRRLRCRRLDLFQRGACQQPDQRHRHLRRHRGCAVSGLLRVPEQQRLRSR